MHKIFSFLVEPSSYTMDLIKNIYKDLNIQYIFFYNSSIASDIKKNHITSLDNFSYLKNIKLLITVFRQNSIIIFNGYNRWEFLFLFFINFFSYKKRIIAIESDTQLKENIGFKGFIKTIYLKIIFSQKFILGFSGGNYSHKELFRHYGMDEKRIFLLPMMVDNEKFFKNSLIFKGKVFSFLYVGRVIPHKNVRYMIKSFLKVFNENKNVSLTIVGTGSSLSALKKSYGKCKNIIFAGVKYDNDLVQSYHDANVLILPSLYEPWGLVVNEALCAGLPVIASSKVGAVDDLIVNKETGFVFDIEKENDLSNKMIQIYEDKKLYVQYSKNAEHLMKEYWNYNLYRKNLIKAIEYVDLQFSEKGSHSDVY